MYLARKRLASHRLAGGRCESVAELARWMGAIRAQEYVQASWAVGARFAGCDLAEVDRALSDREVLLTWAMRGTIHLVPSEDALWMTRLLGGRRSNVDRLRCRELGIDESAVVRSRAVLMDRLRGGKPVTRTEVISSLQEGGIDTDGQRGYQLLYLAGQSGLICFGPRKNKSQTFVLLNEWFPDQKDLTAEEGFAELAGRYIRSHGPVLERDFARWTGLTLAESRKALRSTGDFARAMTVGDDEYWFAADAEDQFASEASAVHLLPGFDEYFIGYRERSGVIEAKLEKRVIPGKNGVFKPILLIDGRVAGTWSRKISAHAVDLEIDLFDTFPLGDGEIEIAARKYAAFMGVELRRVEYKR